MDRTNSTRSIVIIYKRCLKFSASANGAIRVSRTLASNLVRQISLAELSQIPLFVRFNSVCINFIRTVQPIEQQCESICTLLQPLRRAFIDCSLKFKRVIGECPSCRGMNNPPLFYVDSQLLPLFGPCRSYTHYLSFRFGIFPKNVSMNYISSLLLLEPISRCAHVSLDLFTTYRQKTLPIEAISNWLNRDFNEINFNGQEQRELLLELSPQILRQNSLEMFEHLKKVGPFL